MWHFIHIKKFVHTKSVTSGGGKVLKVDLLRDIIYERVLIYLISLAAHCILNKGIKTPFLPRYFRIILGGHDLNDPFEIGRETRPIKNIIIHPDWNPDVIRFDADIAIMELDYEILFNNYIQPICLSDLSKSVQITSGTIVGYGKSEDQSKNHENVPKVLNVPIHSQESCFLTHPELAKISSERTFCAGSGNGTGACLGEYFHYI